MKLGKLKNVQLSKQSHEIGFVQRVQFKNVIVFSLSSCIPQIRGVDHKISHFYLKTTLISEKY